MTHLTRRAFGAAALAGLAAPTLAQPAWPERPIRWIVAFPPAGTADITSRLLAERLGPRLGQPVVVENRAGAGGMSGTDVVAKARGDTHVVTMSNISPLAISPTLFPNVPYDPVRDFTHIALLGVLPMVIAVNPAHPARTIEEFLTGARARVGAQDIAFGGNGTASHLIGLSFQRAAGVTFTWVPYRGAGPALTDVLAGVVPAIIETLPAAIGHIHAGRLRPLAVSTPGRSAVLPDVPSFGEVGLAAGTGVNWFGFSAPAGLSAPVTARWLTELRAVLELPEMRERLGAMGFEGTNLDPAAFTSLVSEELARWRVVIRENNVQAE